ncbi:MAG: DUF2849 domain-containing protein [Jannaschia sp.]
MTRRPFVPKVVTANRLLEGDVVYLAADDRWVTDLPSAEAIEDEAVAEARLLDAMAQADRVVGAYLADIRLGPDGPEPIHFREAFRASGPTNYPHGKAHEAP